MKKWIIAFVVLTAVGVGCVAWWRYVRPQQQVSDLYRRYEHVDGIAASYIHNYPVNDTLSLDVTLLEATDSDGWQTLSDDFGIIPLEDELQQKIDSGKDLVFVREVNGQNMKVQADSICDNTKLIAISYLKKTVCIFHVADDKEIHSVYYHNFDKTTNKPNF